MSEADDRELEEEARALLRPARDPLAAPAEVRARALRRLSLALPIGGAAGQAPPGPVSPHGGSSGLGRALAARVPAWSLIASFVAGGAAAMMIARPAPKEIPPGEAPVPPVSVATALPERALPIADPAPSAPSPRVAAPVAPVTSPPTHSAPARAGSDGLEAERAVLDVARTALGRGDGGNALRATEEHGRRFPRGLLAEEREAMSIQALRLLHRDDEAQARLERFRGRFPTSLIRPALEAPDGGSP